MGYPELGSYTNLQIRERAKTVPAEMPILRAK
jgi:hypothetical protein